MAMTGATVRLGFRLDDAEPVDIPLRHLIVTGQTQEAGKTTTLEALIRRSERRAIAFVTKRGEGSFEEATTVRPFFRDQADWQFVASILEASRSEKLRFERAWIIRASKGAQTLREVQINVRRLMAKAKGMSADVYLTLDAYLDVVVPQIAAIDWAPALDLHGGLNVMDLSGMPDEMQHLVIRSSLQAIHRGERGTIVVIPEAWKFLPQGRGTPVKLAAEAFIRQAAAVDCYLWLDSQDIGGIEKTILRSVPVWLLGVQREANEIKRTLANIPAGIGKPKADQIAHLGIGQFIAAWGRSVVPTYVWPAWLPEDDARDVAAGGTIIGRPAPKERDMATNQIEADLLRENRELRQEIADLREQLRISRQAVPSPSSNHKAPVDAPGSGRHPADDSNGSGGNAGWTPAGGEDGLYQRILARLRSEAPAVLRVAAQKPEIEVSVERHTVKAEGSSWLGFTASLIAEGYFDDHRTSTTVFKEGKRRGMGGVAPRADEACKKLTAMGFLTSEGKGIGYRAVEGMKVNVVEG